VTAGTLDRFATQIGGASPHDPSGLLRASLRLDGAVSALVGALLLAGAPLLDGLLGPPARVLALVGAGLIAWGGLWFLARRRSVVAAAREVVAANVAWVALSIAVVAAGWLDLTPLGTAFVLVQASAVMGFVGLQVAGLRRAGRPPVVGSQP
jgi:hypothetical protein